MKRREILAGILLSSTVVLSGCQLSPPPQDSAYSIAFSYKNNDERHIHFADADGNYAKQVTNLIKIEGYPSVSPDGTKMAFYGKYDNNKTWSIHIINLDGSGIRRITNTPNVWDSAPSWSADSQNITFAREYKNEQGEWQNEIWLAAADGSNTHQVKSLRGLGPKFISKNRILFFTQDKTSAIYIANRDGSNLVQITHNDAENWYPDISPNEQKIVFMSNRDGNREIYTMNIDGTNQKRLTNNNVDDWNPSWSSNGEEIVFTSNVPNQFSDIYKMNHDGSELQKLITGASQASWIKARLILNSAK
ncbi:DUF5050 domain-containing protein [Thalassotalea marina]|uniref:DUF5050 domain-containing protein n=1 Tax=Thalassotalea marina TaxID=1673741 RepID=A0A919BE57_9GAMM|nr:DUF5050 domain-containing protein [Thalassotalea marina]GHF84698.1 hypothetical protein GCM10017161_10210 [Thalassotalea marina]